MADTNNITKEYLHEIFEYKDGELYRKINISNVKAGAKVGFKFHKDRYLRVRVNKKLYLIHRLIFMMHYGYFPEFIDHIDGNPLNNKVENLRSCTQHQNNYSSKVRKDSSTGIKGISKSGNKFVARCRYNKKENYLGTFESVEDAISALKVFRAIHHMEFAKD